jgi:protein-disulfide isomerase
MAYCAPKLVPPLTTDDHILGSAEDSVLLLEYGDYQCPYCKEIQPVIAKLKKLFGKRLALAYRHFPFSEAHPQAFGAAVAAEAAAKQKKFWIFHKKSYAGKQSTNALGKSGLERIARSCKLNMKKFSLDFGSSECFQAVKNDFNSGMKSGVNGTPTFFINGRRYDGEHKFKDMAEAIQEALEDLKNIKHK